MTRGKVKATGPSQTPEAGPLDRAEVRFLLGPHGPIAKRLSGYEVRWRRESYRNGVTQL